jgi:hypothetical protein
LAVSTEAFCFQVPKGCRMIDPPPILSPEELPSRDAFAEIALQLLREQAKDNEALATRMRKLGIPVEE